MAVVGSRAGNGRQEGKIAKTQNLQEMAPELKCEAVEGNPLTSRELGKEASGYQSSLRSPCQCIRDEDARG